MALKEKSNVEAPFSEREAVGTPQVWRRVKNTPEPRTQRRKLSRRDAWRRVTAVPALMEADKGDRKR